MVEVLILSISKPLLIGIYKDKKLQKTIAKEQNTSDILADTIDDILKQYNIRAFYYTNGPGSYLSIKLVYVFLSTISIIKKIPFFGANGFYFNDNCPIKAIGNKYFFNKNHKIILDDLKDAKIQDFYLPYILKSEIFKPNLAPLYELDYLN